GRRAKAGVFAGKATTSATSARAPTGVFRFAGRDCGLYLWVRDKAEIGRRRKTSMLTRRRAFAVFVGAGLSLVTACSGSSSPGIVELTITAADDINPDAAGRASPVVLRIYQLAAGTQFQAADFFQLFEKEAPTLGPDLVAREEVIVAPSDSRKVTIT